MFNTNVDVVKKINREAMYSLTKPYEASQIIKIIIKHVIFFIKKDSYSCTITDGTAGSGGDTLNFSKYFNKVNSVEVNKNMYDLLINNTKQMNNIRQLNADYMSVYKNIRQDVIYLDPPWGGPDYKSKREIALELSNWPLYKLVNELLDLFKKTIIVIKAPLNIDMYGFKCVKETCLIYNQSNKATFKLLVIYN